MWNPLTTQKKDAEPLEIIIEEYNLILNNKQGAIIRSGKRNKGSIINLAFITIELGPLESWAIDDNNLIPLDYTIILFK